ncbi:hypothetical protein JR316_0002882 [Psilocybe cubensis]|uniref:Uncharacterized protein n=2 Tax=Psilocybe cubensis TaxID=181762 RepID=A0A8H7Y110_PSICU|nr:hypothetical protein JR316_0002882 [Psilocybe cubensis]KAH9483416.1 hypothetical protein JR316_0002882 [Psilocybe cubensis]
MSSTTLYSPIYKASDVGNTARDPFGILPFNRRIRETKNVVLEFKFGRLQPWSWPLNNSVIVPPADLQDYRRTHLMRFPQCLCGINKEAGDPTVNTESVVFQMVSGGLQGCIVAACVNRSCKYFINLDRIFRDTSSPEFRVCEYPLRTAGELPPPPLVFDANDFKYEDDVPSSSPPSILRMSPSKRLKWLEDESIANSTYTRYLKRKHEFPSTPESSQQAIKRQRLELSGSGSSSSKGNAQALRPLSSYLRKASPPAPSEVGIVTLLLSLDDNGLSMREFQQICVVCNACNNWVGTPSALEKHYCSRIAHAQSDDVFIDLTSDLDD